MKHEIHDGLLPRDFDTWRDSDFDLEQFVRETMEQGERLEIKDFARRIIDRGLLSEHERDGLIYKGLTSAIRRIVRRKQGGGMSMGAIIERRVKDKNGDEVVLNQVVAWKLFTRDDAIAYDSQRRRELGRDVARYAEEWVYLDDKFPGALPPCPEVLHTEPASTEA